MSKLNLKYLYSAGAAAALTAAAISIPAWGDSGGGQSGGSRVQRAPVPMLPPPGNAASFARGEKGAQHAAEARKNLDELTDCLRENGVEVPQASSKGRGFSIQLPRPEARSAMEKAAKECVVPGPPSRGQLMPLSAKQREQARKAMKSLSECMRSKGQALPVPPPLPPRK